jgi:hypothetical protein
MIVALLVSWVFILASTVSAQPPGLLVSEPVDANVINTPNVIVANEPLDPIPVVKK